MDDMTTIVLRDKKYEVKAGTSLLAALNKLEILPETVICTRNGELITEDTVLKDGDTIRLISVISGG